MFGSKTSLHLPCLTLIQAKLALLATLPEPRFVKRFYALFLSDNASKIGQSGRSSPWQAEANVLS